MNKYQSNNFLNIKCGYCGDILVVATQEEMLCHNCFEHYDEKMHAVSIDEDFVVTIVPNSNQADTEDTSNEHQSSTDHRDEMLINVVQTKPALYNFHKFPPSERSKAKKKALWKEVENMLGELMTADDAMKRWKYLRDCCVRYKRQVNAYVPSGSSAQPKKQKIFRFYEIMQFIDDPLESAPTVSNLSNCDKAAGSAQEDDDCLLLSISTTKSTYENRPLSSTSPGNSICKSRPLSSTSPGNSICESRPLSSTSPRNSICESRLLSGALRRPSQTSTPKTTSKAYSEFLMSSELRDDLKNVLNTPVPQKDAIDHFVLCLSDGMRKLSRKKSRLLQIAILQLLADAEEEEAKENNF